MTIGTSQDQPTPPSHMKTTRDPPPSAPVRPPARPPHLQNTFIVITKVYVPDADAAWARASVLRSLGGTKFEVRVDGIDDNDEAGQSDWGAGDIRNVDLAGVYLSCVIVSGHARVGGRRLAFGEGGAGVGVSHVLFYFSKGRVGISGDGVLTQHMAGYDVVSGGLDL